VTTDPTQIELCALQRRLGAGTAVPPTAGTACMHALGGGRRHSAVRADETLRQMISCTGDGSVELRGHGQGPPHVPAELLASSALPTSGRMRAVMSFPRVGSVVPTGLERSRLVRWSHLWDGRVVEGTLVRR